MANIFKRKGLGIVAAVLSFCALGMIVMALVTEQWVSADLQRKSGNTTSSGGTKTFGLFDGHSVTTFGIGDRERKFKGKNLQH